MYGQLRVGPLAVIQTQTRRKTGYNVACPIPTLIRVITGGGVRTAASKRRNQEERNSLTVTELPHRVLSQIFYVVRRDYPIISLRTTQRLTTEPSVEQQKPLCLPPTSSTVVIAARVNCRGQVDGWSFR